MWWHANLRQDHKHVRSDEDHKMATLGGILAEEIHKTPSKSLAGATCPMPAEQATLEPVGSKRRQQLHWNQGSGGTSVVACRSL